MKVVIINKSDTTGGAAVVSRRLMEALREEGVDARMLVVEKLSDSPYIEKAALPLAINACFLTERLKIYLANGRDKSTLFKIDTGDIGLPLWRHPLVKEADAILINWVNQGMLSLTGIEKILRLGKPVIFTMHDMWYMTGICHHSMKCFHFMKECGNCPLLGEKSAIHDLSYKIHKKKSYIFCDRGFMRRVAFVPVSNWLKERALFSSLLKQNRLEVIPNAFKIADDSLRKKKSVDKIRVLFGAYRLDDPIKGLDTLKETAKIISESYPELASKMEIAVFGDIKQPDLLADFSLPIVNLGILKGDEQIAEAYRDAHILVSPSSYETLPGTLVEGQAFGCIPVCFHRGGQRDIIDQQSTGYMAEYSDNLQERAKSLADGISWACSILKDENKTNDIIGRMRESVQHKFSYQTVAKRYINLINTL